MSIAWHDVYCARCWPPIIATAVVNSHDALLVNTLRSVTADAYFDARCAQF